MSISVIIPTYNREAFISEAVQSVIDQNRPCDELIIVDDGSTDNTRKIIEQKKTECPVALHYVHQQNQGAAAARNTGVRQASSGYLCFLDSDDRYMPEKLSVQYQAMQQSEALISHTRETWFRCGRPLRQKKKHQPREGYIFKGCLEMCVVGMSTVMVRKELFEKYGLFDEQLPCCEDYDFWLRVSTQEYFQLVPEPLTVKHGGRADQLSVIYRLGMDKYRIRSIVKLLEQGTLTSEQHALAVNELRRKCRIYGNGCLKHGRREEGKLYLQIPERFA